jgi:hypothetical protein
VAHRRTVWLRTCGLAMACRDLGHVSSVSAVSFRLPGWREASYRLSDTGTGTMWLAFTQERWVSLAVTGNRVEFNHRHTHTQGLNTEVEIQNGTRKISKFSLLEVLRKWIYNMVFWVTKPEDGASIVLRNLVATIQITRYFPIRMFNDRIKRLICKLPLCNVHIT